MTLPELNLIPEWAPQQCMIITWPHAQTDWTSMLREIENTYSDMAQAITSHQELMILCYNQAVEDHVNILLEDLAQSARLNTKVIPTNDTWIRDHGPLSLESPQGLVLADFEFTAWGKNYPSDLDNAVNQQLIPMLTHHSSVHHPFPLEGGAIETNGNGLLMITDNHCQIRYPQLHHDQLEARLHDLLGVKHLLCVPSLALPNDDTDGHIDMQCRFVDSKTIVYTSIEDQHHPSYQQAQLLRTRLEQLAQQFQLLLTPLPSPTPEIWRGQLLPATYCNFSLLNEAILVPIYQQPSDDMALSTLQALFPDRQIHPIDSRVLIRQYGALHCATLHIPRPPHENA